MIHCDTIQRPDKLKLSIFDSIRLVNSNHWQSLAESNVYLSIPYLEALEESLSDEIDFRYIVFYNNDFEPVGIATVQLLQFTDKEVNIEDLKRRFNNLLSDKIVKKLDARVLLCGNAFSTGENGFTFCDSVPNDIAKSNLDMALDRIKRDEKKANNGVSIILLKDFWPDSFDQMDVLHDYDYADFMIDMNMVMQIQPQWKTFDDYLNDMVTKFRTKVKAVYKKSAGVEARTLNPQDIQTYSTRIKELYQDVLDHADYRFGNLEPETFEKWAEKLPDNFIFRGYFIENELVGFCSSFLFNEILDANFVGIDYEVNYEHALYQRMLCDLVQCAIEGGVKELRYGRTAEEIKSSFGAEPVPMKLFVKHRNSITNKLIKPLVSHITPGKFDIRRPFKAVMYQ